MATVSFECADHGEVSPQDVCPECIERAVRILGAAHQAVAAPDLRREIEIAIEGLGYTRVAAAGGPSTSTWRRVVIDSTPSFPAWGKQ